MNQAVQLREKALFYLKIRWDKDPIKSFFPIPNEREIRVGEEASNARE